MADIARPNNERSGSSEDDDAQLMMDEDQSNETHRKEIYDGNHMQVENSNAPTTETVNGTLAPTTTTREKEVDGDPQKRKSGDKVEKDFAELKEKFFKEKIASLKREIDSINNGTHPGFCEKCKELEQVRDDKIYAAEQWRSYQLQNINNAFDAEKRQADEEYKAERQQMRERMIQTLLDKRKKLSDDKVAMGVPDADIRTTTRTLRRRGGPPQQSQQSNFKKKLNSNLAPQINYTLQNSEIQEDLNQIVNFNKPIQARR